jgi:hypothetical protein
MDKWFELESTISGVNIVVYECFSVKGLRTNTLTKMCIDKFEAILKVMKDYEDKNVEVYIRNLGIRSCPLCLRFNYKDCTGCPILAKTGLHYCYDTPYWDIAKMQPVQDMIKNLEAEIEFLKGILKNEPWL